MNTERMSDRSLVVRIRVRPDAYTGWRCRLGLWLASWASRWLGAEYQILTAAGTAVPWPTRWRRLETDKPIKRGWLGFPISRDGQAAPPAPIWNMDDLQYRHGSWAQRTFPSQTPASIVAHLAEEVAELAAAHRPEEAADCLLLLLGHAHVGGYSLWRAAGEKHRINLTRQWGAPDANGVVHHVKAEGNT